VRAAAGPPPYLAGLRLGGRRVVVVGGGAVAVRRVAGLVAAAADVAVVAPAVTPALEEMATKGDLIWHPRRYVAGDLAGAWYVVAATDDPDVNAAVAAHAEAARIFCSRADDAEASSAWTPATGRHGDLGLGVIGGDPRRTIAVRDYLLEALRTFSPPPAERSAEAGGRTGSVAVVGAGPGAADLVTLRALRVLQRADVVVTDRLVPLELLDALGAHVQVIDAAKVPDGRSMAQEEINRLLVEHALAGREVVRFKGGDPFVFGRGHEEVLACAAAGVPVVVVPGITSAVAVPAAAGIPVTHRGTSQAFAVVSGHVAPGDPRSTVDWHHLAGTGATLVLLMAVKNLAAIAGELQSGGLAAATPVACVQDGTTPTQRVLRMTLAEAAAEVRSSGVKNPAVIVIGEVAGLPQPARPSR
jgi:uroporphyrin-III C-methyltransferase/precorrin-2 dehydrogenase/sirohydrochlorin ferrochelatase